MVATEAGVSIVQSLKLAIKNEENNEGDENFCEIICLLIKQNNSIKNILNKHQNNILRETKIPPPP